MLSNEERKNIVIDPIIEFCYDYILPISQDRILATHGGEISLITIDGNMICSYESIEVPEYNSNDDVTFNEKDNCYEAKRVFIDDLLIYRDNGLYGIIDYDGNIVVEAKYKGLRFNDENALEISIV